MKKINIKSGAMAAVLAGTMALSMVPATAFAADATTGATVTQTGTAITKDWTVASEAQYDAKQAFSFDLTYVGATSGGYSGDQVVKYNREVPVKNKVLKTVKLEGLSKKGDTLTYEKTFSQKDLFSGFTFETPGVYHFQLKEKDVVDNKNVVKDDSVYDVYVNVAWEKDSVGKPEVQSVKFTKDNKTTKSDSAAFNNTAKGNHTLTVSKTVAGTAANTGDVFSFKLTVENATGKYNVKKGNDTTQLTAGVAYDFTLKDAESIEVQNLPEGATYTVEETDAKGYDSTDVADEDETTPENVEKGKGTPTGQGTINNEDDTVAFTNNKGFAPETGITMNSLAGIAVTTVAVAGGVTLVIRRRNRAGEDF